MWRACNPVKICKWAGTSSNSLSQSYSEKFPRQIFEGALPIAHHQINGSPSHYFNQILDLTNLTSLKISPSINRGPDFNQRDTCLEVDRVNDTFWKSVQWSMIYSPQLLPLTSSLFSFRHGSGVPFFQTYSALPNTQCRRGLCRPD